MKEYDTVENWKMIDEYKEKAVSLTNDGSFIVLIDPLGNTRIYANHGGVAKEVIEC